LYESVSDAMEALPTDILVLQDVVLRTPDPKSGKTRMHWTTLHRVTEVSAHTFTIENLQEHVMESIKQAAIQDRDGEVWTLPRPNRHHDIAHLMYQKRGPCSADEPQGFLTDNDRFVDRKEAALIAVASGQIDKPQYVDDELFSEDLW
jgi:hypothetical protein